MLVHSALTNVKHLI